MSDKKKPAWTAGLGLRKPGDRGPTTLADLTEAAEQTASKVPGKDESLSPTSAAANRQGTTSKPYIRSDGAVTRTSSVTLPVELFDWVRVHAAKRGCKQSDVIREAVLEYKERVT